MLRVGVLLHNEVITSVCMIPVRFRAMSGFSWRTPSFTAPIAAVDSSRTSGLRKRLRKLQVGGSFHQRWMNERLREEMDRSNHPQTECHCFVVSMVNRRWKAQLEHFWSSGEEACRATTIVPRK